MKDFLESIRGIFSPQTAEDRMAIVPLVGCVLPLVLVIIAVLVAIL